MGYSFYQTTRSGNKYVLKEKFVEFQEVSAINKYNEMFNDIKEESNPDEIHVVGYTFKNGVIIVAVTYFDECLECGAMYEEFDIALEDFIEYLQND
jgi:hypothetical protein